MKVSRQGLNENIARNNLFDVLRHDYNTLSIAELTYPDKTDSNNVLGFDTKKIELLSNVLNFGGRWGITRVDFCSRDLDPSVVEVLNELNMNVNYFCNYIDVGLPISFIIRRITASVSYVIFKDIFSDTSCIAVVDTNRLEINTTTKDRDIAKLVEEGEDPRIFYTRFSPEIVDK